jgi:hypothetical protein
MVKTSCSLHPLRRASGDDVMKLETRSQSDKWETAPLSAFLSRHGPKVLALVPLAALVWLVAQYAVAVPYWDQWELVPLLDKSYHGELTFSDLWAQHNEHRLLFPQIIMLTLARLTGWDIRFELALNIAIAIALFAVFVHQVKITGRKLGIAGWPWAVPAISLAVFSLAQYQNWLWGWQMQMLLNLLAVVGGIVLLANGPFHWGRFAAAAMLGIVATYSFANGMLFWPIGLALLFVTPAGAGEKRAGIIGWILISALTLGFYFYRYQPPEGHPPLSLIFKIPFEYAAFVLKYIGNLCAQYVGGSVAADGDFALAFGLAAIVAWGWSGGMLIRKRIADARTLLPYFALSLYSFASALMTGAGRVGFGSNQAIYSRYSTMVVPLWVCLIVLLFLLRQGEAKTAPDHSAPPERSNRPVPAVAKIAAGWALLAAITFLALGSVCAIEGARDFSRLRAYGRICLLNLANPGAAIDLNGLSLLYPRPEVIRDRCPVLVKHRLSVFRDLGDAPDSP